MTLRRRLSSDRAKAGLFARLAAAVLLVLATGAPALAATPPAGPPFPEREAGRSIYDFAGIFGSDTIRIIDGLIDQLESRTKAQVVVYSQVVGTVSAATAEADAAALLKEWAVGRPGIGDGVVVMFEVDSAKSQGKTRVQAGAGFQQAYLTVRERQQLHDYVLGPLTERRDWDTAVLAAVATFNANATAERAALLDQPGGPKPGGDGSSEAAPPPGPPFPEPQVDRAVYDYAEVFRPDTIAKVEAMIDEIEARTGAEIVVYTQVGNPSSTSEAEARAIALMDQWGVGRRGFDDGLVILFDLDDTKVHGQVQLYAGPGYRAAFLSNGERQAIFENDMLPLLRSEDLDGALLVAMDKINANATSEHAALLNTARQLDAAVGLVLAPTLFVALLGWAVFNFLRYGRDPVYLDDPSIHMPAPPEKLTAAAGAAVMDGGPSRRALTTAMLDLASRGLLSFREQKKLLGLGGTTVGIEVDPPPGDPETEARRGLNARKPFGPAEGYALDKIRALADSDGYIEPDDVPKFGPSVSTFNSRLESEIVRNKWMAEVPSKVTGRWRLRGTAALIGGVLLVFAGANIPSNGLLLLGVAGIAGGVVLMVVAGWMPSVTMSGAMIRAMLHAYRRTLQKTMASARSMQQVVEEAHLPWLETPDQAVVWGTALGLQSEIEDVLKRSLEDVEAGRATASSTYFPAWYTNSSGQSLSSAGAGGGGGGLFSSSAVPNIGGMMAALSSIGNSPSSSGSSGGGGFSGGSSGGGGGGSGGGF